jgi:hypothetical protein
MKVNYHVRDDPITAIARIENVLIHDMSDIVIVVSLNNIEYTKTFTTLDDAKTFIHNTFMFWKNPKLKLLT